MICREKSVVRGEKRERHCKRERERDAVREKKRDKLLHKNITKKGGHEKAT